MTNLIPSGSKTLYQLTNSKEMLSSMNAIPNFRFHFILFSFLLLKTHQIPTQISVKRLHQLTRLILLDICNEIRPRTFRRVICEDHLFINFSDLFVIIFEPSISDEIVDVDPVMAVGDIATVDEDGVETVAVLTSICELLFKSRFQVIGLLVEFCIIRILTLWG